TQGAMFGGRPLRNVGSPTSASTRSHFGLRIRGCVVGLTSNAHGRSLLTGGLNTFRNSISTRFGALGCSLRVRSDRPRRPSLRYGDRSEGRSLNAAVGRIP